MGSGGPPANGSMMEMAGVILRLLACRGAISTWHPVPLRGKKP